MASGLACIISPLLTAQGVIKIEEALREALRRRSALHVKVRRPPHGLLGPPPCGPLSHLPLIVASNLLLIASNPRITTSCFMMPLHY